MSKRDKLSDKEVEGFLAGHPGWKRAAGEVGALCRTFTFDDYAAGIAFAVRVGFAAEARDHHPDLQVGFRRVEVLWSTHDAGGITALDAEMAERTDELAR